MLIKNLKRNNFAVFGLIAIALFLLFLSGCSRKNVPLMPPSQSLEVAEPAKTPVNSNKQTNSNRKNNMEDTELSAVKPGNWGATGISLVVEENGAKIEYDCANGEIKDKLMINENGEFEADGTHTRESFGPIREGKEPKPQPAHYEGKIAGDTMTLKAVLTDTKESIGDFTLERDKSARLRKCQ